MTHTYLIKRNGKYHFRIRVPKDLRSSIRSGEIHRSLGTSDNRLAKTLAANLRAKVESEFVMLRHQRLLSLDHVLPILPDDEGHLPSSRLKFAAAGTSDRYQESSPTVGQLIEEFSHDREKSWSPKSKQMHLEALRLFAEFVNNKPIAGISRKDCRDFKNTLAKLPPRRANHFPGKSISEVAKLGLSPMSPNTVNRNLNAITSFFNWALLEQFIDYNPAQRLRMSTGIRPDHEREAFGLEDLRLLFERSPLYRGCLSEKRRLAPGSLILRDSRFWLPLIALYSLCSRHIIAQLYGTNSPEVYMAPMPQEKRELSLHYKGT